MFFAFSRDRKADVTASENLSERISLRNTCDRQKWQAFASSCMVRACDENGCLHSCGGRINVRSKPTKALGMTKLGCLIRVCAWFLSKIGRRLLQKKKKLYHAARFSVSTAA